MDSLTPKEEKYLRQLLGQDYFRKEFTDEQIHRVLLLLRPSMRQRLKIKEILPFLRQKPVLFDTEMDHIEESQPTEQGNVLVECLMNKGISGIEMLYLCLLESSEKADGVPSHYQLAVELKEIVQVERGICASSGLTAVSSTHLQQQSLDTLVERLYKIPLDPETAKIFTANLGLSSSDFRTPPIGFQAICQCWLSQGNAPADLDQLVEALVSTRGLGRHTSSLCSPVISASAASLEVHNFLLSLGERWVELAGFLGFSGEEVEAITEAHASNIEQQVVELLKLWQFPECSQRTLPLMHKLKGLAGIVQLRKHCRRPRDRPAAVTQSAATILQGTQIFDDQPVDAQADLMQPSSLQTLPESQLTPPGSFTPEPGSPLHMEHTSEPYMAPQAFLPNMSQRQPLRSTGNKKPSKSVQPQQRGASDVLSATATSIPVSPGSSHSMTPVGMGEGQGSTSEIRPTALSESSITPLSSQSTSQEHMAPTSTSHPLVRTPSSSKSVSPIPEALPPQATSSQTWQPGPPLLTTAQVTSSQPWRPGTPPFSTTQATSSKPWQPGPLPPLATSSINNFDPPVRAVLPRHPHPHSGGGATVSLQQVGEVARAQAGEESVAMGELPAPDSLSGVMAYRNVVGASPMFTTAVPAYAIGECLIVIPDVMWNKMREQELFPPSLVNDANIPPDIHCKALYEMYEDLTDLDFESLLPHMKNQGIVSKEAEWHLRSDHISPMRKLQIMMNDLTGPGKKMAESVFLCLLDCHESCHNHTDVPFTLANALKRAVLSESSVSVERQQQYERQHENIENALKSIRSAGITVTKETATELMKHLGLEKEDIIGENISIVAIFEYWREQQPNGTIEDLICALLSVKGLGRFVSGLFPISSSNPPAVQRMVHGLKENWKEFALHLGFSDKEIGSITALCPSTPQQIRMFLRAFRMPDLKKRTEFILYDILECNHLYPPRQELGPDVMDQSQGSTDSKGYPPTTIEKGLFSPMALTDQTTQVPATYAKNISISPSNLYRTTPIRYQFQSPPRKSSCSDISTAKSKKANIQGSTDSRGSPPTSMKEGLFSISCLHGVDRIIDEIEFVLTDETRSYEWTDSGFKIYTPHGALPAGVVPCQVNVKASLSGQFEFPENSELVSPIYWISTSKNLRFSRPLTVHIQHCGTVEDRDDSDLSFVVAKCTQPDLPYKFKFLDGGLFTPYSSYGSISVTHFSGLGIISKLRKRSYCARTYVANRGRNEWRVYFIILRDLNIALKAVDTHYNNFAEKDATLRIVFEENEISLDIPKEGQLTSEGWKLLPQSHPSITKEDADRFHSGGREWIPACELIVEWVKSSQRPVRLRYQMPLIGAKAPKNYFTIAINPECEEPPSLPIPQQTYQDCTRQELCVRYPAGLQDRPQLCDLMNEVAAKIPSKWRQFGIELWLTPDELDRALRENLGDTLRCFSSVFTVWKKTMSREPYSWQTVVESLKAPAIGESRLALELSNKFTRTSTRNSGPQDRRYEYEPVACVTSSSESSAAVQLLGEWVNLTITHLHRKWYELGRNLRLNKGELDYIGRRHSIDINCCRSVIEKWVGNNKMENDDAALKKKFIKAVRNTDESLVPLLTY